MSPSSVPAHKAEPTKGTVVPFFVCGGARAEVLPYALLGYGDGLEEIVVCPMRNVCAWHAGHDLGGTCEINEQPEAAILPPNFRTLPYFSCPNFYDFDAYCRGTKPPSVVTKTLAAQAPSAGKADARPSA